MKSRKSSLAMLPLRLKNDQPFTAGRLRLFFNPTRTVLVDAYVGTVPPKDKPTVKPVKLAFELDLDPPGVESEADLTVVVRYERSRPELAAAIWVQAMPAAPVNGFAPAAAPIADEPLAKLPYTRSTLELAQLRRQKIQEATGLERARKDFFFQLDVDTDKALASLSSKSPALLGKLHNATEVLRPVLFARVQDRGRYGHITEKFLDPLRQPKFRTSLNLVMKCLEDLIQKSGLDTPGVPVSGLDATFEAFARGDLRVLTTIRADDGTAVPYTLNGEPDSPNYFLLAELAILACKADPSSLFWPKLLRIFVSTQKIYSVAYKPAAAADQGWADFSAKTYCGPGVPSDDVVADFRSVCAVMNTDALEVQSTTNAQDAFCW